MMRRLALSGTLFAALMAALPLAMAGQEESVWEFNLFGGRAKYDSGDLLGLKTTARADFDDSGTPTSGSFVRSLDIPDDNFIGARLGYNWTKTIGSELVYDRNHIGADFDQRFKDFDLGGAPHVQTNQGRVGVVVTSYQLGILYYPLGKWRTRWQPYATLAGGYIDIDLAPSGSLKRSVSGGPATNVYRVDFPKEDNGVMFGYGAGVKYFVADNVAVRAEVRGKTYDLFDQRRNDAEATVGISFFAPGN